MLIKKAHFALVEFEKNIVSKNRKFTLITMNIDRLHSSAGSKNVIEMHGNVLESRCQRCSKIYSETEKVEFHLE